MNEIEGFNTDGHGIEFVFSSPVHNKCIGFVIVLQRYDENVW